MKVLVLGSNGMAGHVITKYLISKGHSVTTFARSNADIIKNIEDTNEIILFFNNIKNEYDFIINCIGLLVKESNNNPAKAAIVNSWFPHIVEECIKNSKTKLIHLSTDCVFNGEKGNYTETDIHSETNFYGKSKSYGEVNNNKDVTFRMSIIGPELKNSGTGLLHWIINTSDDEVNGWSNVLWNGITTLQLAKCIDQYIHNPIFSGVYHLVNNNISINKYELLCKINDIYQLDKHIKDSHGPKNINKVLVDTRLIFDFEIPNYDTQLTELKEFI